MRIRDEIRLGVAALLIIEVLTMIAAVALLARMTPAIDQILEENEKSIRGVEDMLLALAEAPPADPRRVSERRDRFERALTEAEGNMSEAREEPVLAIIAQHHEAALAGDAAALAVEREQLSQLRDINRETMLQANERAKQLGTAGAWALVLLGLIGLVASLALMRRARVKLIMPVYELGAVLDACRQGDARRRFMAAGGAREFQEIAEVVNVLVHEHFATRERSWEAVARLDRIALLRVLDAQAGAVFVCESSGVIAAANEAGLDALHEPEGRVIRAGLQRACAGEVVDWIAAESLSDAGWLCRLRAQPPGEGGSAEGGSAEGGASGAGPSASSGATSV